MPPIHNPAEISARAEISAVRYFGTTLSSFLPFSEDLLSQQISEIERCG
jgi:hypothetical protein